MIPLLTADWPTTIWLSVTVDNYWLGVVLIRATHQQLVVFYQGQNVCQENEEFKPQLMPKLLAVDQVGNWRFADKNVVRSLFLEGTKGCILMQNEPTKTVLLGTIFFVPTFLFPSWRSSPLLILLLVYLHQLSQFLLIIHWKNQYHARTDEKIPYCLSFPFISST